MWKINNAVSGVNKSEIVLIDPNSFEFSQFIFSHCAINNIDIKSPKDFSSLLVKYDTFYGRGDIEPGRILSAARDCIDIAVKIGFKLNELQLKSNDINLILTDLHSAMSNEKKRGEEKISSIKLMRDAHSSAIGTRENFIYLYKLIINDLKYINLNAKKDVFK